MILLASVLRGPLPEQLREGRNVVVGERAAAVGAVAVRSTHGTQAPTVGTAQALHREGQEELLAQRFAEVDAPRFVVRHDQLAILQLDVLLLLLPGDPREIEEIQRLSHLEVEGFETTGAIHEQARSEPATDVNGLVLALLQQRADPTAGLETKAGLPLEVHLARLERTVEGQALLWDLEDLYHEHRMGAQTLHFTHSP